MCLTPTFLFKSHVSVSPPPAKHPFNNPSTGLISTRSPSSPLQGGTQVTTVIARGSDHLLNCTAPDEKSLCSFFCAIYAAEDGCPFKAQLLALLETNFFFGPLKTLSARWKLS